MALSLSTEKKIGVVLSYVTIGLNTLIAMFFTPFLISSLGDAEYGVYKVISSFSGYLNLLNFGTSTIIARYIAKFSVTGEKEEQENFLAMMGIITGIVALGMGILGFGMSFLIEPIYGAKFNAEQLALAKKLFFILILNIIITIIDNTINGIQRGYEKFVFIRCLNIFKIIFRTSTMLVLLLLGKRAFSIVLAEFIVAVIIFFVACYESFFVLKVKVKYHYFNKEIFKIAMTFSLANILQAVVNLVNQSLDMLILGAMVAPAQVTVYSLAITIFTTFGTLSDAITSVFVPQATKIITRGADGEQLTDFAIKIARISFMASAGIAFAFLLFGKDFVTCWMGENYTDAYICAVILMFPMIINFTQGICVSILDAYLKRLFRSIVLVGIAVINGITTVFMVKWIGMVGAAIATSVAVIIGHIIVMNIYYHKVIHLNIPRMFKGIFKGLLPAVLISTLVCSPLAIFVRNGSWVLFFVKCIAFVVVYVLQLWLYAFNDYEKDLVRGILYKFHILKKHDKEV